MYALRYTQCTLFIDTLRAQRDSIRSQTIHSKGTAYDITKYQTILTKYGIVCPFKRTFANIISCNTLFSGRNTPLKARITC